MTSHILASAAAGALAALLAGQYRRQRACEAQLGALQRRQAACETKVGMMQDALAAAWDAAGLDAAGLMKRQRHLSLVHGAGQR